MNVGSYEEVWQGLEQTIEAWARSLEISGFEPTGHAWRVAELSMFLARRCGISAAEQLHVIRGALLHDIGKFGIPEAILNKPGKLEPAERAVMEQHPNIARQLMLPVDMLRPSIDIPYCHHERWDGKGYPRGLAGEAIPLHARIFAVVDTYDALTHDQSYRAAWTKEEALEYIESAAGTHFDPAIVREFLILASDAEKMAQIGVMPQPLVLEAAKS